MKLTDFEISKVYGMYFGSRALLNEKADLVDKAKGTEFEGYVQQAAYSECKEIPINASSIGFYNFDYLKLLLTPIEKISDEDCEVVAKIIGFRQDADMVETFGKTRIQTVKAWTVNGNSFVPHFKSTYAYQYLLSKSYAVPLFFSPNHPSNGKTAIELGIAIEKRVDLNEFVW